VARAVVDVCDRLGVGLFIPEIQGCCGIPALSAGDTETFQSLVRHNLNQIRKASFDYLVTACATCTATIRKLWPQMISDHHSDLRDQALRLAEKTLDITQFLVDKKLIHQVTDTAEEGSEPAGMTYHDPCHLRKSLGVSSQPRELLRSVPGHRLLEMPGADQCCGMGGSFNLKYYGISHRIGQRKRDSVVATGCRIVTTACPACMLQLTDVLSQARDAVTVKHVIEVYAEGMKRNADAVAAHQTQEN
jgi:glycolate oxidase iron-sulfur subunit